MRNTLWKVESGQSSLVEISTSYEYTQGELTPAEAYTTRIMNDVSGEVLSSAMLGEARPGPRCLPDLFRDGQSRMLNLVDFFTLHLL